MAQIDYLVSRALECIHDGGAFDLIASSDCDRANGVVVAIDSSTRTQTRHLLHMVRSS